MVLVYLKSNAVSIMEATLCCLTIREATLSWDGEGSFIFTSSSAPYDCSDIGSCDEVSHLAKNSLLPQHLFSFVGLLLERIV